jgi:hypothetical protein
MRVVSGARRISRGRDISVMEAVGEGKEWINGGGGRR